MDMDPSKISFDHVPSVLTIAGSDCSGGAGIQADLKTITALGLYGSSVITAATAQNTKGVFGIHALPADFVEQQLECILSDIPPSSVKIGMLLNTSIIEKVSKTLIHYDTSQIVVDPIMISTSGKPLLEESAVAALIELVFPLSCLITPNIPEAEYLISYCNLESSMKAQKPFSILTEKDMYHAAKLLSERFQTSILLKAGHLNGEPNDLLYTNHSFFWFRRKRISNPNTHGTGCTLSSAIACGLAQGMSMQKSIETAKSYLNQILNYKLNLGQGNGPLFHAALL